MKSNKKFILYSSLAYTVAICTPAFATENGVANAANGADSAAAGFIPDPGFYGLAFVNNYSASRFNDSDGHSLIPGFKVKATALAFKSGYATDQTLLGGQVNVYAVASLVSLTAEGGGRKDSKTGFGDTELGTFLSWHHYSFHTYVMATLVVPTAAYDKNNLANVGTNYTTFRPQFAVSYLPESGIDLSTRISYSINTKNQATNYKSGQYIHADYYAGYSLNSAWKVGMMGYYLHQTTDDTVDGEKVGTDGFRGNVLAIGPGITYQGKDVFLETKYLTETQVRNRPEGHSFWVKCVWKF